MIANDIGFLKEYTTAPGLRYEFSCFADAAGVHDFLSKLRLVMETYSFGESLEDQMLILGESVSNMAEHAHKYDSSQKISVVISVFNDRVDFIVSTEIGNSADKTELAGLFRKMAIENPVHKHKYDLLLASLNCPAPACEDINVLSPAESESEIDSVLKQLLSERGRGLFIIKHITGGNTDFDYDGRILTHKMTYFTKTDLCRPPLFGA